MRGGLSYELYRLPNVGPKGLTEVKAFRVGQNPSLAIDAQSVRLRVELGAEERSANRDWMASHPSISRLSDAVRVILTEALSKVPR